MKKELISTRALPVFVCFVGIFLSSALLTQHGAVLSGGSRGMCGPGGRCDAVSISRWSVFPPARADQSPAKQGGIPVAMLGIWYFIFLAAWFLFVGEPAPKQRQWHWVPVVAVLMGCAVAAFLVSVMYSTGDWCVLCLTVHLVTATLGLIVLTQWPARLGTDATSAEADYRALAPHPSPSLITAVFGVTLAAGFGVWQYASASQSRVLQAGGILAGGIQAGLTPSPAISGAELTALDAGGDATLGGTSSAAMTLVAFTDPLCGPCAQFEQELVHDILPKFGTDLHVVLRQYPLCTDCNPFMTTTLHPGACDAALIAEAARRQGGMPALIGVRPLLMGHSGGYTDADIALIASTLRLDANRLQSDRASASVRQHVETDIELGKAMGVSGTPSIYLDGKLVEYASWTDPNFWSTMAQQAHQKAMGTMVAAANVPQPPPVANAATPAAPSTPTIQTGQTLTLAGPTIQGNPFDIKSVRGKPVLVAFWASWCPYCKQEMPNVVKIYQAYHSAGLEVVGVSLDNTRSDLENYARDHGLAWPQVYFDQDGQRGWQNPVAVANGIQSVPTLLLIDAQGRVAQNQLRGQPLEAAIAKTLGVPDSNVVPADVPATQPAAPAAPSSAGIVVGDEPTITGPDITGRTVDLKAYRGKPVLVEFWASWCHFCQGEMPNVASVYDRYHGRGLEAVGISLDNNKADLVNFVASKQIGWSQIFFDSDASKGFNNPIALRFHIASIPFIALVDATGRVTATNLRGDALDDAVAAAFGDPIVARSATSQPSAQ